jgi:hypothetical protein
MGQELSWIHYRDRGMGFPKPHPFGMIGVGQVSKMLVPANQEHATTGYGQVDVSLIVRVRWKVVGVRDRIDEFGHNPNQGYKLVNLLVRQIREGLADFRAPQNIFNLLETSLAHEELESALENQLHAAEGVISALANRLKKEVAVEYDSGERDGIRCPWRQHGRLVLCMGAGRTSRFDHLFASATEDLG